MSGAPSCCLQVPVQEVIIQEFTHSEQQKPQRGFSYTIMLVPNEAGIKIKGTVTERSDVIKHIHLGKGPY